MVTKERFAEGMTPQQWICQMVMNKDLAGHAVRLRDLMSPASYERGGSGLLSRGLYLDLPAWSYHVFDVSPARRPKAGRRAFEELERLEQQMRGAVAPCALIVARTREGA